MKHTLRLVIVGAVQRSNLPFKLFFLKFLETMYKHGGLTLVLSITSKSVRVL